MTETVTAPTEKRSEVRPINHWIGGKVVAGSSGRSGPVYNPATGEQNGAGDDHGPGARTSCADL